MNVFKFNNNRIKAMNKSLSLRSDMAESMESLEKLLNKWNVDLKKTQKVSKEKKPEKKSFLDIVGETKKLKLEKEEEKKEEKKEDIIDLTEEIITEKPIEIKLKEKKVKLPKPKKKEDITTEEINLEEDIKEEKEEEIKEEKKEGEGEEIKEEKKEGGNFGALFGISLKDLGKTTEEKKKVEEEQDKILPSQEVFQKIKDLLLGGFLMKLYLKINKHASNYMTIKKDEKDLYEQSTIKGDSSMVSFIENQVDMQLMSFDFSNFSTREMKEVVQYFDGTRKKKLEKQEKEKKALEKKKLSESNINIILKENKENEEIENEDEIKIKEVKEIKAEDKKEEKIIDLNDPKFIQLERFVSSKLYLKYLTKSYIIKCIFKEIFSYFLNNFHWLCYFVMILNHITSASFLTLFYPISIFCYALLEYPRPPKTYWKIVLLYTVFLLMIKFVIHIEVLRDNETFTKIITDIYNYKIGVKLNESSFSKQFFIDILYDALVVIFLLINDYLLVSRGVWSKREQEIENIYQANERIAKANLIDIKRDKDDFGVDINEVKKFNNKYLEPKDFTKLEDRINSRFSTILITNDFEDVLVKQGSALKMERKPTDYDKMIKKFQLRLSNISSKQSLKPNINDAQKKIEDKIKQLEAQKQREKEEEKEKEKYDESKRKYYERLFPKVRNEKPGNDFYAWYTVSIVFIMLFILIFYTTMVKDTTYGLVELDTKQFSGEMVLVLLLHVAILVYDRVLYISQSRKNLKFNYMFYNNITGVPVSESEALQTFDRKNNIIPSKKMEKLKERYNVINIQNEEYNYILLQKYILHLVIIILSHLFIFFYCPIIGNQNIFGQPYCIFPEEGENEYEEESENEEDADSDLQCNDFGYNYTLIILYLLYIVYYISSSLQIKYCFYDMK